MKKQIKYTPKSCVWELTLNCNARCIHCGSSAGVVRKNELSTDEALCLIEDLRALGCESITFSGGEPLLRRDWEILGRAVTKAGMRLEMITNGLAVELLADRIARIGFFAVTFSIDGDAEVHDLLRRVPKGLSRLLEGARALKKRGVLIGAATQVNLLNKDKLKDIHQILIENDFDGWQVQLTMPHGEAAKNKGSICLDPKDLPALEQTLVNLKKRSNFFLQAADNIGYMSRCEPILRSGRRGENNIFTGCHAGMNVIGISSDGNVRGCLSLPAFFNEGNIRTRSLKEIWTDKSAFAYNRSFNVNDLKGACAHCSFNKICRAGCKSLTFATTGTTTNNPYCLRRLEEGWE